MNKLIVVLCTCILILILILILVWVCTDQKITNTYSKAYEKGYRDGVNRMISGLNNLKDICVYYGNLEINAPYQNTHDNIFIGFDSSLNPINVSEKTNYIAIWGNTNFSVNPE